MNKHYFWISAKVKDYYKFINKLNNVNAKILQIKYENKKIYLKVDDEAFKKINKYLISYKFKKEKEVGIFNVLEIIKKYIVIVISFIIGIIFFLIITNLIVDVKVIHEDSKLRELILDELDTYGIKKLRFKKSYEKLQIIKKKIKDKYPDKIDWLEIEINGMNVIVRVEERIITNITKEDAKCNIVAKKDGMITNIKIERGVANVALFDNVKEGDVLISGIVKNNDNEVSRVCASGLVYANSWYTVKVSVPFEHIEYKKTGKKKLNIVFNNGVSNTKILKDRFKEYESKYKTILKVFDYKLLLESEYEHEKKVLRYSEEEAYNKALDLAEESILKKLDKKDKVIDKKVLKKHINDSTMDIEVFIIANEQIGSTSYIEEIEEGIDSIDSKND